MIYARLFLLLTSLSTGLWASSGTITETVDQLTDILSTPPFQTTKEATSALASLERKNVLNSCEVDIKTHPSCQGFADSLLPKDYKKKGWKTLLELKYRSLESHKPTSVGVARYWTELISNYRERVEPPVSSPIISAPDDSNGSEPELVSEEQLEKEVAKIRSWYARGRVQLDPFEVRSALIIEQLQKENHYKNLNTLTQKNEAMFKQIAHYTKNMSNEEYLKFVTTMAGAVEYNTERSKFKQSSEAAKGIASTFELVTKTKNGICGDIHAMAAKLGEARGWEAVTVGYALAGSQHVVTVMTNPKDPEKMMLVNYNTYELTDMDKGNWINPTPTTDMKEIGMQLRIFKNDNTADPMGKMQQIATIPTALGSFMNELFKRESHITKAMPANNNFNVKKLVSESPDRHEVNVSEDGNKITDRLAGDGIVVYEGQTDGSSIYGVAVSRDVYENIYVWDDKEKRCVLSKNKYFAAGVAGSMVVSDGPLGNNQFYVYLNMKGGKIYHVYQSDYFQFKGVIGYEMEGFVAPGGDGAAVDVNFTTLMGVVADFNKNGTKIHTALTYESNAAFRDQTLWTDMSKIPSNINPMSFNAVSMDANISQKINNKMTIVSNNNFTLTRVGARVLFSTGVITGNTSVMASYEGGVKPFNIGNTLQTMNLLRNVNNTDGLKLSLTQKFSNPRRSFSGSFSAYGGISTGTERIMPSAGTTLKINLGNKKRRPNP